MVDIIVLRVDHRLIAADRIVPIQGIQTEEVPLHLAVIFEGNNDPTSKEMASRQLGERHDIQVLNALLYFRVLVVDEHPLVLIQPLVGVYLVED